MSLINEETHFDINDIGVELRISVLEREKGETRDPWRIVELDFNDTFLLLVNLENWAKFSFKKEKGLERNINQMEQRKPLLKLCDVLPEHLHDRVHYDLHFSNKEYVLCVYPTIITFLKLFHYVTLIDKEAIFCVDEGKYTLEVYITSKRMIKNPLVSFYRGMFKMQQNDNYAFMFDNILYLEKSISSPNLTYNYSTGEVYHKM